MLKGKILRGLNKILLLSLVLFLLSAVQFPINTLSATEPNKEITIDISYGYGNIAKGGRYLPIHVYYKNFTNDDFAGKEQSGNAINAGSTNNYESTKKHGESKNGHFQRVVT